MNNVQTVRNETDGETDPSDRLPPGAFATMMVVVLGALPVMLDTTIVNIAINHLKDIFSTNLAVVQWAVTGHVLALSSPIL